MRIRRNKSGFTLVEILVSMAITAALLAAVAAALQASISSYQENQKIAAATQTARTVLSRMMRDIRTADAVETTSFSVTVIPPSNPDGLQMIRYESPYDGKLHYYRTVNGDTSEYILIGDEEPISVESFHASRGITSSSSPPPPPPAETRNTRSPSEQPDPGETQGSYTLLTDAIMDNLL